jgi:hypothetical protein
MLTEKYVTAVRPPSDVGIVPALNYVSNYLMSVYEEPVNRFDVSRTSVTTVS